MPAPVVINQTQPNGTIPQEHPEQRIERIGQVITKPMIYEYFFKDAGGDEWAERMFDMWPEDYVFMRGLGADNIIARYRQSPAWPFVAAKEGAFIQFIQ